MSNFITAKQFLEQPMQVQQFFTGWKPKIGKLFFMTYLKDEHRFVVPKNMPKDSFSIPLLQTHHLIQFIEDKTGHKVNISFSGGYNIRTYDEEQNLVKFCPYDGNVNLLNALWQTALEIINEGLAKRCLR